MFILETEFPNIYKFDVRIAENGGLEFLYNKENSLSKTVDYENLSKFIKEEFLKARLTSEEQNEEILGLYEKLENLKITEKEKEDEYHIRQKQVTTYLECKRSFFGRIKYYFKGKVKIKPKEEIIMPKRKKEERK